MTDEEAVKVTVLFAGGCGCSSCTDNACEEATALFAPYEWRWNPEQELVTVLKWVGNAPCRVAKIKDYKVIQGVLEGEILVGGARK